MPIAITSDTLGIIGVTLRMAVASTAISSALGIILGFLLEKAKFPGKPAVVRICRTLMGTPPVVVGLVAYLLLMRRGPLGFLGWIFTVPGMVFAQVLLITPITCGMVYTNASRLAPLIRAFAKTMGANSFQSKILMLREMRNEIYFAVIAGFGRAISEVGSVMIVGGNIHNKTRTMTTTISLLRNMGNYDQAITLGIILLLLAFLLQSLSDMLHKDFKGEENI
ncbi:MAG: ABC transporter permease [Treponema sp.]|jgi:tungstate transport system permease protein|nr:ABC transporter permease [Treponema sp.]